MPLRLTSMRAAVSALCGLSASAALAQSFQGLGDLIGGALRSEAYGVSADGQVVVGRSQSDSSGSLFEAFRWAAPTGMVGLGYLAGGGAHSEAYGASADGSVVVGRSHSAPGYQACRWTAATGWVGLGDLPGGAYKSEAYAVSADGTIVVGSSKSGNSAEPWTYEAFRWSAAAGMVGLGDLAGGYFDSGAFAISADGAVIAGISDRQWTTYEAYYGAFRWTQAAGMVGIGELAGGDYYSWASGISCDGLTLVGSSSGAETYNEAFRWTQATGLVSLGNVSGGGLQSRWALAASGDGSVIVGKGGTTSGDRAFIWDAVNGMRRLQDVLVDVYQLDLTGWTLWQATGISADARTIVGFGQNPGGATEAWIVRLLSAGDLDCDGDVDFDDIDPFIDALSDPTFYHQQYPECDILNGDCNGDGAVDFDDVNAFIAAINARYPGSNGRQDE